MAQGYVGFSTPEELNPLLIDLFKATVVAFDIETDTDGDRVNWPNSQYGLSFVADPVVVSFAWKSNDVGEDIHSLTFGYEWLDKPVFVQCVKHLLTNVRLIVAHNAVFDLRQLAGKPKFGGQPNGFIKGQVWDTLANARILHPEKQEFYGMPYVAKALGFTLSEEHLAAKDKRSTGHEVDHLAFMKYCESDTVLTYQMYEAQLRLVDSEQLFKLVEWENRASRAYAKLAARGVKLNVDYVKERILTLEGVVESAKVNLAADGLLEPSKRLQIAEYLYVKKRLPLPIFEPYSMFYTDKAKKEANSLMLQHDNITIKVVHTPKPIKLTKTSLKKLDQAKEQGMQTYLAYLAEIGFSSEDDLSTAIDPPSIQLGEFSLVGKSGYGTGCVVEWDLSYFSLSSAVMIAYLGDVEEIGEFDDVAEVETSDDQAVGVFKDQLKAMADYVTSSRMLTTLKMLLLHASYDGRIHSLVSVATHTGRRASQHPQVQNWHMRANPGDPAGDMCGVAYAEEGAFLAEFDFNNAENRIAAVLSADNRLAEACMSKDFHAFCAAGYFGERFTSLAPKSEEWDRLRTMSKSITFGTAYGMGATKLAAGLGITVEEAQGILAAKDQAYPRVALVKRQIQDLVLSRANGGMFGYINLWSGRKVPVNVNKAYKAWNYGCQGGVGEMLKRSITTLTETLEELGLKSYPALDMHDAVIMCIYLDEYDQVSKLVSDTMQTILPNEPYNTRTIPNMAWIADVDLKKNAKKWGRFMPHPHTAKEEVKAEPKPSPFVDKDFIKIGYESEGQGDHKLALYDLDYVVPLSYPPFTAIQEMSPEQVDETINAITGAVMVIEQTLNNAYQVNIPLDDQGAPYQRQDGSNIFSSDKLLVSIDDWCIVPVMWVNAAELAGVDVSSFTRQNAEKMKGLSKERVEWVNHLRSRLFLFKGQLDKIKTYLSSLQGALLAS